MKQLTMNLAAALFMLAALLLNLKLNAQTPSSNADTLIRIASGDVPRTISYQGEIKTSDGTPVNGTHHIIAHLYADRFAQNEVWQGSYDAEIQNGLFNITLGSGNAPLPDVSQLNHKLWIGVSIDGSSEMQPLTELTSAPYALNVPNKSITYDKLADEVRLGMMGNGVGNPKTQAVLDDPCHSNSDGSVSTNIVAGGCSNAANSTIGYSSVLGGTGNTASGEWSSVLGGGSNLASDDFASVSGGFENTSSGKYSSVSNGYQNTSSGRYAYVGAGYRDTNAGSGAFIGSGEWNMITTDAYYSGIVAGAYNYISYLYSFIGAGLSDTVTGNYAAIGAGQLNACPIENGFIGAGESNLNGGYDGFVGAGISDTLLGSYGVIVGGGYNKISSAANVSTIVGGSGQSIAGTYSFIGGGASNTIDLYTTYCAITAGNSNHIGNPTGQSINNGFIGGGSGNSITLGDNAVISGGDANSSASAWTSIGGGRGNSIGNNGANYGVISGGFLNAIQDNSFASFIGGGAKNVIDAGDEYNTIGGGCNHLIKKGPFNTICGGFTNIIDGTANGHVAYASIGGGSSNSIIADNATIPGGDNLLAKSYAQTVVGRYNSPQGNSLSTLTSNGINRLFIIGNGIPGTTPTHSNAFEVSEDGHSLVYGANTTNVQPAIKGARTVDNTCIAWGRIPSINGITDGFGLSSAGWGGGGANVSTVILNYIYSDTDPTVIAGTNTAWSQVNTMSGSSVVATIEFVTGEGCANIQVSPVTWNGTHLQFQVHTFSAACGAAPYPYSFHVYGRP